MEAARSFYESAEYAPLLKLRTETSRANIVLAEGHDPA